MTLKEYDDAKKLDPSLGDPILIPRWLWEIMTPEAKASPVYVVVDKVYEPLNAKIERYKRGGR